MQIFFAADAQVRAAVVALEAEDYGQWISRLRYANQQLSQLSSKGTPAIDARVGYILALAFLIQGICGLCRTGLTEGRKRKRSYFSETCAGV